LKTLRWLFRIVETKFFAIVRNRRRLIAGLGDSDSRRVRLIATRGLAKIGNANVVEPLITALSDSDKEVRSVAAGVLGIIGDVRAVEPLIVLLSDSDQAINGDSVKWQELDFGHFSAWP